ncbi:MAG: 50S ribosomal protein L9 [Dehalococcoidia bacterium]
MKVVFLEDVAGTADAGEIKEVKNGFARNYLLPKQLAAPATRDQLQRIRAIEKAAQDKRLKYSKEWSEVAKAMDGTHITIEMRVGPSGRLFGAVTSRRIAEDLSQVTGREIEHRQVLLGSSINEPGDYPIDIRLYRDVHAKITVSVMPEGYLEEQAARAAAGETAPEAEDSIEVGDLGDEENPEGEAQEAKAE